MQTVRADIIENDYLVYQLIKKPGVCGCRSRQLSGDIQSARCKLQKTGFLFPFGRAGVVVNISAELPRQNVQAKIMKRPKTVIHGVKCPSGGPLWLNCCGAEITQLYLSSERHKARL